MVKKEAVTSSEEGGSEDKNIEEEVGRGIFPRWMKMAVALGIFAALATSYYIEKIGEGKVPVALSLEGFPSSMDDPKFKYASTLVERAVRYKGTRRSHNIFVIDFFYDEEIKDLRKICDRVANETSRLSETFFYNRNNKDTTYDQFISRVELQLYNERRRYFDRIIEASWMMDHRRWRKFGTSTKACKPQMEYIDYDVDRLGRKGTFSQHVDNFSTVTVICMLTKTSEYTGGSNYFFVNDTMCEYDPRFSTDQYLEIKLNKGECLFMRGEVVTHGVNDVNSGRRVVLQTEMSEVKMPPNIMDWDMNWNGELPGKDCTPLPHPPK
eukprot:CAMPEP_0118668172 /NCGR_PEP_ID=MMETSP0785-20121206/20200_1 /TAXON_ID=91992 /ORGANISM="Bolidomonas pacifica, Strain CCMP 1866" /LENGTH=323 /DNA_ID=CAMNT_0006562719 /DNA_START=85 /DNA_END=1057 /DNA_ORIENTATION=-